jgi:hypothetical protein
LRLRELLDITGGTELDVNQAQIGVQDEVPREASTPCRRQGRVCDGPLKILKVC